MNEILEEISEKIIGMEPEKAGELTQKAIDEGLEPEDILNKAMIPAMDQVGDEYEKCY